MKFVRVFIAIVLCLVFVLCTTVRFDRQFVGPSSAEEKEDFGISAGSVSLDRRYLILQAKDRWFVVDLVALADGASQTRAWYQPQKFNTIHWKSGQLERPVQWTEKNYPVDVRTTEYASFGYKSDGRAWHDHENQAVQNSSIQYSLYRSAAEQGRSDYYLKSILLQGNDLLKNGTYGYQIFYDPDVTYTLAWGSSFGMSLFGPAFLGMLVLGFTASSRIRWRFAIPLFLLAGLLFFVSAGFIVVLAGMGAAWSGGGNVTHLFWVFGLIGLGVLALAVLVKSIFWNNRF